ncbi:MAG: hypothetical protein ACREUZ_09600 [Burkholderiales bacterium]
MRIEGTEPARYVEDLPADLRPQGLPALEMPHGIRRGLAALDIIEILFDATNGNVLGFARGRSIAVTPLSPLAHKTRFHEIEQVLPDMRK